MKQQLLEEFEKRFTYKDDKNDHPRPEVCNGLIWGDVKSFLSTTYDKAYAKGRGDMQRINIDEFIEEHYRTDAGGVSGHIRCQQEDLQDLVASTYQKGREDGVRENMEGLRKDWLYMRSIYNNVSKRAVDNLLGGLNKENE